MNPNLTASYQAFKDQKGTGKCVLSEEPAKPYQNGTWKYSNHILQEAPNICGYLVSITNTGTARSAMFSVIRSAAEALQSGTVWALTLSTAALYLTLNM